MDYIVVGYPRGLNGHYIELGRVVANSKEESLMKVHKSIFYDYHALEFTQEKYNKLKDKLHFEIKQK